MNTDNYTIEVLNCQPIFSYRFTIKANLFLDISIPLKKVKISRLSLRTATFSTVHVRNLSPSVHRKTARHEVFSYLTVFLLRRLEAILKNLVFPSFPKIPKLNHLKPAFFAFALTAINTDQGGAAQNDGGEKTDEPQ